MSAYPINPYLGARGSSLSPMRSRWLGQSPLDEPDEETSQPRGSVWSSLLFYGFFLGSAIYAIHAVTHGTRKWIGGKVAAKHSRRAQLYLAQSEEALNKARATALRSGFSDAEIRKLEKQSTHRVSAESGRLREQMDKQKQRDIEYSDAFKAAVENATSAAGPRTTTKGGTATAAWRRAYERQRKDVESSTGSNIVLPEYGKPKFKRMLRETGR